MTNPYQPRPGTAGARAITALQEHGGSMSATQLAEALGIPPKSLHASLKAAHVHGLLLTGKSDAGASIWRLPAEGELAAPAEATTRPRKKRNQRTTRAQAAPAAEDAPSVEPAIASLWDDGDVVLQGIAINEDAGSVTLSDSQARRVHRFLERVYGPTV